MGSVAATGTAFPRAMSLLGPHCHGTWIGRFSMEVLSLTHIPREGLVRQKFLLFHPATGGVCFVGEEDLQSVLHSTEGMEREKCSALLSSEQRLVCISAGIFLPSALISNSY